MRHNLTYTIDRIEACAFAALAALCIYGAQSPRALGGTSGRRRSALLWPWLYGRAQSWTRGRKTWNRNAEC